MLVETDLVGSVTEVAVTVTLFPAGRLAGAVKFVAASLVVVAGLKEPHTAPPQLAVHCICGFAETSFAINARTGTVEFTCIDAGIDPYKLTEIGIGGTIVITADTDLVVSTAEVAVTVTLPPEGMVEGAV